MLKKKTFLRRVETYFKKYIPVTPRIPLVDPTLVEIIAEHCKQQAFSEETGLKNFQATDLFSNTSSD